MADKGRMGTVEILFMIAVIGSAALYFLLFEFLLEKSGEGAILLVYPIALTLLWLIPAVPSVVLALILNTSEKVAQSMKSEKRKGPGFVWLFQVLYIVFWLMMWIIIIVSATSN